MHPTLAYCALNGLILRQVLLSGPAMAFPAGFYLTQAEPGRGRAPTLRWLEEIEKWGATWYYRLDNYSGFMLVSWDNMPNRVADALTPTLLNHVLS